MVVSNNEGSVEIAKEFGNRVQEGAMQILGFDEGPVHIFTRCKSIDWINMLSDKATHNLT